MGSPAQTAPLVLSQGGVKNCQEDTALREPPECPPPNYAGPVGQPRASTKTMPGSPQVPPGKASSRWEPQFPVHSAQGGPHLQRLWSSPPGPQVSMVMVAGAPFTATKMSLVSLAGNRPALHPPQYPPHTPVFKKLINVYMQQRIHTLHIHC